MLHVVNFDKQGKNHQYLRRKFSPSHASSFRVSAPTTRSTDNTTNPSTGELVELLVTSVMIISGNSVKIY